MTCLKLPDTQEGFTVGKTAVMHHLKPLHKNCESVHTTQIATESFTARRRVVLAKSGRLLNGKSFRCRARRPRLVCHIVLVVTQGNVGEDGGEGGHEYSAVIPLFPQE